MPTNATFKQREYARLEALARIAYDEYHNGVTVMFDDNFTTWSDLTPQAREIWVGVVQAVRVGVLRGVA